MVTLKNETSSDRVRSRSSASRPVRRSVKYTFSKPLTRRKTPVAWKEAWGKGRGGRDGESWKGRMEGRKGGRMGGHGRRCEGIAGGLRT